MNLDTLMANANDCKKSTRNSAIAVVNKQLRKADQNLANLDSVSFVQKFVEESFKANGSPLASSYKFAQQYLIKSMFSKYMDDTTAPPQVCWDNAMVKLRASESRCKNLNDHGLVNSNLPFEVTDDIMQRARAIIGRAIGLEPDFAMFEHAAFGCGATTCRTRTKGDPYFKYNTKSKLHVTEGAYNYASALIGATPLWDNTGGKANLQIHRGNTVFSVN